MQTKAMQARLRTVTKRMSVIMIKSISTLSGQVKDSRSGPSLQAKTCSASNRSSSGGANQDDCLLRHDKPSRSNHSGLPDHQPPV